MKSLFLIDGSGGTGKSGLLRYVVSKEENAAFIPKYTTREIRHVEKCRESLLDLRFPPDTRSQFMERTQESSFYWYIFGESRQGKEHYGFYKDELINALAGYDIVLVIVRNLGIIQRIKEDFSETQCVSVFMHAEREVIFQRLKQDGIKEEEIEQRLNRKPRALDDYLKHPYLYDERLINNSGRKDFELMVDNLLEKYGV